MLYIVNNTGTEKKPYNKDEIFKNKILPVLKRTNSHLDPDLLDQFIFELKNKLSNIPLLCKKLGIEEISQQDLDHRVIMILKIVSNRNKKVGQTILNQYQIYHGIYFKDIPTKKQDELFLLHK